MKFKAAIVVAVLIVIMAAMVIFRTPERLFISSDPIQTLVDKAARGVFFDGGIRPILELPQEASPEEIIKRYFERDGNGVKEYKIIEVRNIYLGSNPQVYFAALVKTNLGKRIILYSYSNFDWSAQMYDAM